jgi:hypothetical protein
VARWAEWSGDGIQHLVLNEHIDRIVADGAILTRMEGRPFAATYHIECDAAWHVKIASARLIGSVRTLDLRSNGSGHWQDERGRVLRHLDGAIDVDVSVTPFTNTLPIRRLDLVEGQSVDIRVAYLRLPDLTVTTDLQRYTCLERGRRYRYESIDSDFVRDIEVDEYGLVVVYPGLFRRVL